MPGTPYPAAPGSPPDPARDLVRALLAADITRLAHDTLPATADRITRSHLVAATAAAALDDGRTW